ncbi:hypothetical protein DVH24_038313 [Malus domestica]|uniref:Uncharacterized protein n=1 Tax=Malus domestica TaxID=3750 RepID=A0A498K6Y5_MALDO|nr:hypothetical protein DVH24_038313 [Malus domestica]
MSNTYFKDANLEGACGEDVNWQHSESAQFSESIIFIYRGKSPFRHNSILAAMLQRLVDVVLTRFAMCLYGFGLLPILSIGFTVEPQFHYGIRARLSTCEAQRSHSLHVTQLLSTYKIENLPHVRGRAESCPTSVRDKVCSVYVDAEGEGAVFEDAFCLEGCEFGGANLRDALFVDLPTFTNHI